MELIQRQSSALKHIKNAQDVCITYIIKVLKVLLAGLICKWLTGADPGFGVRGARGLGTA